jgi:hypothetical protein
MRNPRQARKTSRLPISAGNRRYTENPSKFGERQYLQSLAV